MAKATPPRRSRLRPIHGVLALLALAPLWRLAEWARPRGARPVSPEAVAAGAVLFHHEWTAKDPMAGGDGLGPVFNARSCVDCHSQGAPGGGGPVDKNVTVYGLSAADTKGLQGRAPAVAPLEERRVGAARGAGHHAHAAAVEAARAAHELERAERRLHERSTRILYRPGGHRTSRARSPAGSR